MDSSENYLFAPPDQTWTPVCERYAGLRRLLSLITWLVLTLVVVMPQLIVIVAADQAPELLRWTLVASCIAMVALGTWRIWRQEAIASSWGYAERETDLFIKSGIFNRRLTVVPYGRMQAVNISAGPLDRLFNLANVRLVTASAQSDAIIPGLEPGAAALLRDRLTERGETQATGL